MGFRIWVQNRSVHGTVELNSPVTQGTKKVMIQTPQLPKQPNSPCWNSDIATGKVGKGGLLLKAYGRGSNLYITFKNREYSDLLKQ